MESQAIAGMYDLEETLGSGHFAVVKLARHVITGDHVAVKVIDKTKLDKTARDHLYQEVRCMKLVQHPSIIRLYQVIDTASKLYLILELGENGDLYEYISKHSGGVGEDESRDLFRQIVEAISYCHRLHVVHRDLKPENVVFCENATRVKITDFGLSNLFAPGEKLKTSCGSLSYAAPEILLGDTYDAPAVDLWSLGVILYMLLVGEKPFVGGTDSETLTMIMDCRFDTPSHLSPDSIDLVRKLLVSNPKERIALEEIYEHPWMVRTPDGASVVRFTSQPHSPMDLCTQILSNDHRTIVQSMVSKGVADEEEIEQSLDANSYDHIAATYYIMAEAHLKKRKIGGADVAPVVNHLDLERLDRRRQHVRKLSNPCSPNRTEKLGLAIPTPRASVTHRSFPLTSPDGNDVAYSPQRHMRRGAAETGILFPLKRTPVRKASSHISMSICPNSTVPSSSPVPMRTTLPRAGVGSMLSYPHHLQQSGQIVDTVTSGSSVTAGNSTAALIGSFHFTVPPPTGRPSNCPPQYPEPPAMLPADTVDDAEMTPPASTSSMPFVSQDATPARSLVQIDESEVF